MSIDQDFYLYLLQRLSDGTAKDYLTYLRTCDHSKLQSLQPGESLLSVICEKCGVLASHNEKFDVIQNYISEISNKISQLDSSQSKLKKNLSNIRSALRSFSEYVCSSEIDIKSFKQTKINKRKSGTREIEQIDGMTMLTDMFPGTKQFIEFVLSGCYFFSANDMHSRFDELKYRIKNNKAIPARHSQNPKLYKNKIERGTKNVIFNDGKSSGDIMTDIDRNGNAAIDRLFTQKTRRYLKSNNSRKADFINLKISHVWGHAYDPRYFTSLWNIVLVPSFANDILDKPVSEDGSYHLGASLLNTLKCILYKYYKLESLNWSDLRLDPPQYNLNNVIRGKYTINVFESITTNDEIPEITSIEVMI